MAPWRSPVRPIHSLLVPRMARRLYLWTLDNPGLTYQEALNVPGYGGSTDGGSGI
jgi:hypothetical protein